MFTRHMNTAITILSLIVWAPTIFELQRHLEQADYAKHRED